MTGAVPEGATPLSAEELDDLLPNHLTTRAQLNAWEQRNILEAERWGFRRRRSDLLSTRFLTTLHRKMFDRTWRWAGSLRTSDKNIGVSKFQVPVELVKACADATTWVEAAVYPPAEAAVRFHHRLVWVHPFADGNGRHARLAADLLLHSLGSPRMAWSGKGVRGGGSIRDAYIDALQAADAGDFVLLLKFVGLE